MASGKETPRQKMINLMYLVFIAMLALNMSKEVLTTFGEIDAKVKKSTVDIKAKNASDLDDLEKDADFISSKDTESVNNPISKSKVFFTQKKKSPVSTKAKIDLQPSLNLEAEETSFELPSLSLLESKIEIANLNLSEAALQENARMLESVLDDYGVKGRIISVRPGPVVHYMNWNLQQELRQAG